MSGGVDSSVAAALLVEQGHTVVGVTMKTFCCQEAEAELTGPTRSTTTAGPGGDAGETPESTRVSRVPETGDACQEGPVQT